MLKIHVRGESRAAGGGKEEVEDTTVTNSQLYLIDLAGSERLSRSKADGATRLETQHINKSLSALGDVIHALQLKQKHVPFRNSKLTYLLKDTLSKQGKVLMLVQVAPAADDAGESNCSLEFAQRAASVELGRARRHVESGGQRLKLLQGKISDLTEALKSRENELKDKAKELEELRRDMEQSTRALKQAQTESSEASAKLAESRSRTDALLQKQKAARQAAEAKAEAAEKKAKEVAAQLTQRRTKLRGQPPTPTRPSSSPRVVAAAATTGTGRRMSTSSTASAVSARSGTRTKPKASPAPSPATSRLSAKPKATRTVRRDPPAPLATKQLRNARTLTPTSNDEEAQSRHDAPTLPKEPPTEDGPAASTEYTAGKPNPGAPQPASSLEGSRPNPRIDNWTNDTPVTSPSVQPSTPCFAYGGPVQRSSLSPCSQCGHC